MKSLLAEPRGKQTPRVSHIPAGEWDYSAGEDALAAAEVVGRESLPWQELVVREGMATALDGKWRAFEVGVLVSRQNGKNGAIEVVELGWMVNEPGVSILHTAHEFQTALESMDKLESLIRSHPKLESDITVRRGNGKESIRLHNGCKLHPRDEWGSRAGQDDDEAAPKSRRRCVCSVIRFRTRTKSGGRGFSVDRLVIDEAMIWSPASQAAIMPLLTTAKNPQIWYLGSAADEETHEYCHKWASLRARAQAGGEQRLVWLEWSAPEPPEDQELRQEWREDRENWGWSNPSLDYLVTEQYIADEMASFRKNLEKWEVERLSTGRWPKDSVDLFSVFDEEKWRDGGTSGAQLVGPRVVAVHRPRNRQSWAIVAAQWTAAGRIHVELGPRRDGSHAGVAQYLVTKVGDWDPLALVIDSKSAAAVLKHLLLEAGIEPTMTTASDLALACGGFLDDVNDGAISHSSQPDLNDAIAAAVKRDLPGGGFAWEEGDNAALAAVLTAASLAHWALREFGPTLKPMPAAPTVSTKSASTPQTGVTDEFNALTAAF
jgi:hypothetical protein